MWMQPIASTCPIRTINRTNVEKNDLCLSNLNVDNIENKVLDSHIVDLSLQCFKSYYHFFLFVSHKYIL